MSQEIWKPTHLTDKYEISNLGRVKTTKTGLIRKNHLGNRGYETVVLKFDKKQYNVNIHKLMMEAFRPDEHFEGAYINHIDGNKRNNTLENLEWCTHQQNMDHAKEKDLIKKGEDSATSKLSDYNIITIRKLYNEGMTQTSLAKSYNVDQSLISLIVNNKLWTHLPWEPKPKNNQLSNSKISKPRPTKCPPKEQLQIDMDTLPWTEIGKKYGVSDNAAKKWAKKYGLDIKNKKRIIVNKSKQKPSKYKNDEEKRLAKNERKRKRYSLLETKEEKEKWRGRL